MPLFIQVEELLTNYLKDVGISEEQFVMACEAGSSCNDQTKVADRVSVINGFAGYLACSKPRESTDLSGIESNNQSDSDFILSRLFFFNF
jgi:hypothetical protein